MSTCVVCGNEVRVMIRQGGKYCGENCEQVGVADTLRRKVTGTAGSLPGFQKTVLS